jgi:hypothetical protein
MPGSRLFNIGGEEGPALSEGARSLRAGVWGMIFIAGLALVLAFAGARRWVPRETMGSALLMFAGAALGAVWLGIKAHRRTLADRDRASGQAMIVLLAAQLGKQDDATLQRIAGKSGPAGEAARMILKGRRGGQSRIAMPDPTQPR